MRGLGRAVWGGSVDIADTWAARAVIILNGLWKIPELRAHRIRVLWTWW